MRDDVNFDNLISKIDCILNSPKPIPNHMKRDRELAQMLEDLQEISEYETLNQFDELFDKEPFLIQFLVGSDFTKLLKKFFIRKSKKNTFRVVFLPFYTDKGLIKLYLY